METSDKMSEDAIIKKLIAQHPDLNEEDFKPHKVSDSDSFPPMEARGYKNDDLPERRLPGLM